MLESLHVKNLALIDETEVEFTEGLNILTGETGAGKSIIIGSINLALGARADKEAIRTGADYALVELVFSLNEKQKEAILQMDLFPEEDNTLILQRKITAGRSICKVNGETVSIGQLKELSGVLLDMYGQHEHQSLLRASKYKDMVDGFAGAKAEALKARLKVLYQAYKQAEEEFTSNQMDENARKREADLLSFEIHEMEEASLVQGEDEELENTYRRMNNAKRMKETIFSVHAYAGYEEEGSAGAVIGRTLRELKSISSFDEALEPLIGQLTDIDNLLNDFNRSLADYQDSLEFDEEEFVYTRERLDILNHLKGKYGATIEEVLRALESKKERLLKLESFEEYFAQLQLKMEEEKKEIMSICSQISSLRKKAAKKLAEKLSAAMADLNFIDVDFSIEVEPEEEHFSEDGYDRIEFLISTNPGEQKRPLRQIASGGELSRIMLAFKTVLADEDDIDTLIFDEIDTGISGKTAWKVSKKMGQLAAGHQILCITHLPQIAAMADTHFLIEKQVKKERTITDISRLSEEDSLKELARLLGSGSVTKAVLSNAREMKEMALKSKN